MSKPRMWSLVLTGLVAAGCGTGGLNYWLYPEPRLAVEEEAVFATYESNRLLLLDGEDVATRCWGDRRQAAQAYSRNDLLCRLHIRPGRHSIVVQTGLNNAQRATVDFTAQPGKVYGIERSGCVTTTASAPQNCQFQVVEVRSTPGGD